MLLFKFCLHWRKGRQKMDANRAYHLTLVMSVIAKHCLKYPSKVSGSKSPFRYTEKNLVHPKALYFNEQPTRNIEARAESIS